MNQYCRCADWVVVDDAIIAALQDYNAICRLTRSGDFSSCRILGSFKGRNRYDASLTSRVISVRENVIFSPAGADEIAIVNTITGEINYIAIPQMVCNWMIEGGDSFKYGEIVSFNNYVYFFGCKYPAIIKLDLNTLKCSILTKWIDILKYDKDKVHNKERFYFGLGYVKQGDKVLLPCGINSGIFCFSFIDEKIDFIPIDSNTGGYAQMAVSGKDILLTSYTCNDDFVEVFNLDTLVVAKIQTPVRGFWWQPVIYDESAYLFPIFDGASVLRIDLSTYECEIFDRLDQLLHVPSGNNSGVAGLKASGSKIVFIRGIDNIWFTYDFDKDTLKEERYLIEESFFQSVKRQYYSDFLFGKKKSIEIIHEGELKLDDYVNILMERFVK